MVGVIMITHFGTSYINIGIQSNIPTSGGKYNFLHFINIAAVRY